MKPFRWGVEKNELLKTIRGVSFESIVVAIESEDLLDMVEHPNQAKYPNWVFRSIVTGHSADRDRWVDRL